MRIGIEVCPDWRLSAAAESYLLASRRPTGRLLALSPIVVGSALLFGGRRAWVFAGALILIGALEATLVPWLQPRLDGRARVRSPRYPRLLELHDGGVRCVSAGYDLDRPWSMFEQIVELPGQYLLMMGGRHYVSVPTTGLSEDQLNDLRALLARRAPATAR
jgi:hypothetical protein